MATSARKPRKLTHRQIVKLVRDFDLEGKVEELFTQLGPLVWRRYGVTGGWKQEIAICTRGGMLQVSLRRMHDPKTLAPIAGAVTGIYCTFDDPDAAAKVVLWVNPYSGKWNHETYVDTCPGITDPAEITKRLQDAWDSFRCGLERITIPIPEGAR